jgi:hypothetical protein
MFTLHLIFEDLYVEKMKGKKFFFSFLTEKAYSISLIKVCSIKSGISTILWKLALDVQP